jgi:membrane associated rhomboid family serine protease
VLDSGKMRAAGMTDSPTDEKPTPPPGRRLEFPILQVFSKIGAAFRASPVNATVIAVCIAIFLVLNLGEEPLQSTALRVLAPSPFAIWTGALWGLVTSAFVHLAWWHILFNMLCARDFGRVVEPDMGAARYAGFIVAAAVVASGWELLVSAATGIGYSGVVYALVGFMLARRSARPAYQAILNRRTILWLLGWLVFCIALTVANVAAIGNAAHIAGLAFGYLVGVVATGGRRRPWAVAGLVCLVAGVGLAGSYMPWSPAWTFRSELGQFEEWRRRAEAGDPKAQGLYGSLLASMPKEREQGLRWLRRAAEAGDVSGTNGLAWWLATAPEDSLRNGAEAVRWAEQAYKLRSGPEVADTLAAAYAEAEHWDDAIAMQESAVRDLRAERAEYVVLFRERLQRYRQHQKWREPR